MGSFTDAIDHAAATSGPPGFESIAGMVRGRLPEWLGSAAPALEFRRPPKMRNGGTWQFDDGRATVEAVVFGPGQGYGLTPMFVALRRTADGNQFVLGRGKSLGAMLLLALQAAVAARLRDQWEAPS